MASEVEFLLTLERELQIARQIQASFLPEDLPGFPGWEIAARFLPALEVAGDFYDAFPLVHNRRLGLVIADVCGKGVGAALFMALVRSLIRAFAQQHYALSWADFLVDDQPAGDSSSSGRRAMPSIGTNALKNAVVLTNNYIVTNHGQLTMFITLFFGILDPATGALAYINAGHNPPFIVGPEGVKGSLAPTGPAVGLFPDVEYEIRQAQVGPGDMLLAYTDGVTEARNARGEFFDDERLLSLVAQPAPSVVALLDRVEAAVRQFTAGAVQSDDITMLAVRRNE